MSESLYPPTQIQLRKASGVVDITWRNGETSHITGDELRRFCACSRCRARNTVGLRLVGESGDVVQLALMGSTGVQVIFADGHDRGVFPWAYLRSIAEGRAREHIHG